MPTFEQSTSIISQSAKCVAVVSWTRRRAQEHTHTRTWNERPSRTESPPPPVRQVMRVRKEMPISAYVQGHTHRREGWRRMCWRGGPDANLTVIAA